jgi:hypothetical protein
MIWQKQLRILEQRKEWDDAIEFMEDTIAHEPDNLDAYLSMSYLLMNLLVEEDYDDTQGKRYEYLIKKYYDESYKKFSHDPKYLFYIGEIAGISEWFFGLSTTEYQKLLQDAAHLDPHNLLYQWGYYSFLDKKAPENRKKICEYARAVLSPNSPIPNMLSTETSLGKYLFWMITSWCEDMIKTGADPKWYSIISTSD